MKHNTESRFRETIIKARLLDWQPRSYGVQSVMFRKSSFYGILVKLWIIYLALETTC